MEKKKNFEKLREEVARESHLQSSSGFDFTSHTERKAPEVPTMETEFRTSN